jgi:glycosyltransferase involved in cell wall biosynthesis
VRVLALVPHPPEGSSTRYRLLQFLPLLERRGVRVEVAAMLTPEAFRRVYRGGLARKAWDWTAGFRRRWQQVEKAGLYDVVFIHREIWPLRGLWLERRLLVRNPSWVFDLDDAVFLPNVSRANRALGFLKDETKSDWIAERARAVTAGNSHLAGWARARAGKEDGVFEVPTAVDLERWNPGPDSGLAAAQRLPLLGWIGSHTTVEYLEALRPVFDTLARRYPGLRLRVIGARFEHAGLAVENVPWSLSNEVDALRGIDIGLAPLPDTPWALGKCGLKVIQYFALGKPVVASPVGVHTHLVRPGETGFLAGDVPAWVEAVSALLEDAALRHRLGSAGRALVEDHYSVVRVEPELYRALCFAAGLPR